MAGMTYSMNGFRRNLASDLKNLHEELAKVMDELDPSDAEDIQQAFDAVACSSNSVNCVSMKGNPDFSNMSDEPCVPLFCEQS